jgi:hypothetical protein
MSQTPEGKIKAQAKTILQELKAYYFFPPANGYGKAGVPDIVGCHKGIFFGLECKAGGNQATALQTRELRKIYDAGGFALVVDENNIGQLRELLRDGIAHTLTNLYR